MPQRCIEEDWRSLAEQSCKEMNSAKLSVLVARLCHALEMEDQEKARLRTKAAIKVDSMISNRDAKENASFRPALQ